MKIRKYMTSLLAIALTLLLSGCQLAVEDADENQSPDQDLMVGVYMTTDRIDLYELGAAKEGRIYASYADHQYTFDGVDGIAFFSAYFIDDGEKTHSVFNGGLPDATSHYHYSDAENSVSLAGTLYITPAASGVIYHMNPVFQTADGQVYLTPSIGMYVGSEYDTEGSPWNVSYDSKITITENGVSKTEATDIEVAISIMFAPEKIVLLQMNNDGQIVDRTEYVPGQLPESFTPAEETAYMLVETHKTTPQGDPLVTRELIVSGTDYINTFYAREDGVCDAKGTELLWAE